MQKGWGKSLRKFRNLAGYSQVEFADALLKLDSDMTTEKLDPLVKAGILPIILDNSELSRYENGKRLPRNRSRFISLIYALVILGGIQNSREANEWLGQADQAPLNEDEHSLVFGPIAVQNPAGTASTSLILEEEKRFEESPLGFWRPKFAMWSALLAVLILIIAVIYVLLPSNQTGFGPLNAIRNLSANSQSASIGIVSDNQTDDSVKGDRVVNLGDFSSGYDEWRTTAIDEEMQTISLKGGALCGDITDAGSHPWAIRWWKDGVLLSEYNRYQLSFDIVTDVDRSIDLLISDRELLKTYYYGSHIITRGGQRLTVEFNQYRSDPVATLSFLMGGHFSGEVCFDNFELKSIETLNRLEATAPLPLDVENNRVDGQTFRNGWLETWEVNHETNTAFDMVAEPDAICFQIRENGSAIGSVNIRNHSIDIIGGQAYYISFEVTSSNESTVAGVWLTQAVRENWELRAGLQTVEHRFVGEKSEDDHYFLFNLSGPDESRICIRDIILRPEN